MTLPSPGPNDAGWGRSGAPVSPVSGPQEAAPDAENPPARARGFRGGRVVALSTLAVIAVAALEATLRDRIGLWTGVTLLVVAVIAPLVTRAGDRSLPAMMPPLAFLAAVLIAGQLLVPASGGSLRTREAVMIVQNLGANAAWVVAATILS
ncbi:MAG TPA: hypothetical protein VLQ92_13915, partial [Candidatus Limnocylindrales bacterium]|nr:hypothetical protein [Candidatus Limnocylindrales bacterium]